MGITFPPGDYSVHLTAGGAIERQTEWKCPHCDGKVVHVFKDLSFKQCIDCKGHYCFDDVGSVLAVGEIHDCIYENGTFKITVKAHKYERYENRKWVRDNKWQHPKR